MYFPSSPEPHSIALRGIDIEFSNQELLKICSFTENWHTTYKLYTE